SSARVHHQQHEVRRLTAELKTNIAAFERVHCRCSPGPRKMLPAAADHHASSIAATDSDSQFLNGGQNNHALGAVQQIFRDIVGNVEDFFKNYASIFNAIDFFRVSGGKTQRHKSERQQHDQKFLHDSSSAVVSILLWPDS